jgi:serine/threonine protein kinase
MTRQYSSHFVKTLGWYESKNHLYIAMTYYPLGDLMAYLDENSVSEDGARQITIQILQGLSIMHQEGYAHRDIKPQVCRMITLFTSLCESVI